MVRQSEGVSEPKEAEGGETSVAGDSRMEDSPGIDLSTIGGEGFGDISIDHQNGTFSIEEGVKKPEIAVESPIATQDVTLNGSSDGKASTSSASSSIKRGGNRNASSKFASLRAAFEQPNTSEATSDSVKRRLSSSEKSVDRVSERKQEYEAEITKLKEVLEKEKEMRIAYEEKVTQLEEESDELQAQLEEQERETHHSIQRLKTETEARLSAMASEARSRSQDNNNLQKQLVDLKKSVSSST